MLRCRVPPVSLWLTDHDSRAYQLLIHRKMQSTSCHFRPYACRIHRNKDSLSLQPATEKPAINASSLYRKESKCHGRKQITTALIMSLHQFCLRLFSYYSLMQTLFLCLLLRLLVRRSIRAFFQKNTCQFCKKRRSFKTGAISSPRTRIISRED